MTEQEYINATDLAKVRIAKSVLSDIIPKNSEVIDELDYQCIMDLISSMERKIYEIVVIKEEYK